MNTLSFYNKKHEDQFQLNQENIPSTKVTAQQIINTIGQNYYTLDLKATNKRKKRASSQEVC